MSGMVVEWLGGPHDGERLEVEGVHGHINFVEMLGPTLVEFTEPISPIGPPFREVSVPVVRWSDGSLRALWARRTPR